MKKTYFVSPNFDIIPPPDGPVKLGHIIPGPSEPDIEPINLESHIEVVPLPPMIKKGFSSTRNKLIGGELGIWAQVMATMGAHASVAYDRSSDDELTIREIETQTFQPTADYVTRSVEAGDVTQFLKQSKYRVPVYMITGFKIARGAAMSKGHGTSFKASGGLDMPIDDVRIGPGIKFKRSNIERESFDESSDFVLAFRLQRIRFRLVQGRLEIRDRETYTKGAEMLGSEAQAVNGPELVGLEDDADEIEQYDDDGERCDVVVLQQQLTV